MAILKENTLKNSKVLFLKKKINDLNLAFKDLRLPLQIFTNNFISQIHSSKSQPKNYKLKLISSKLKFVTSKQKLSISRQVI